MPFPFLAKFILSAVTSLLMNRAQAKKNQDFARSQGLVEQFTQDLYTPPETSADILDLAGIGKQLYDLRSGYIKSKPKQINYPTDWT